MIELLKTVGPILIGLGGIIAAVTVYLNTRGANRNTADKNKTEKYEVLDAKQEQIAEWGFKAADDANKRADRIAAEAQMQVAELKERLAELETKLREQVEAMTRVRVEYVNEVKALRVTHQAEIDERNRRIYALEDTIKRMSGDSRRQTTEGDRQTREGKR